MQKGKIARLTGSSYKAQNGNGVNGTASKDVDFEWIPKEHLQTSI
jgi:hypothetical protein